MLVLTEVKAVPISERGISYKTETEERVSLIKICINWFLSQKCVNYKSRK